MANKCSECQNYLQFNDNVIECDYDMFPSTNENDSLLFVDEQFDCDFWEKHL